MAEIPTLQTLTSETNDRDALLFETIKTDLAAGINAATIAEIEYKFIYDINTTLTAAGLLQMERLINATIKKLTDLGYKAFINPTGDLEVTWPIATLMSSL